jgi:hypothetical protein
MQMRDLAGSHQLVIDRLDTCFVAEKLGYTSHRCVLDNHRKDAGANYLREGTGRGGTAAGHVG